MMQGKLRSGLIAAPHVKLINKQKAVTYKSQECNSKVVPESKFNSLQNCLVIDYIGFTLFWKIAVKTDGMINWQIK